MERKAGCSALAAVLSFTEVMADAGGHGKWNLGLYDAQRFMRLVRVRISWYGVCVCVCLFGWAGWGGGGHAVAVAAVKAALRLLQGQGSGCWLTPIKAASIKLPFLGALTKSRKEQSRVPSLLFSFYLCIICACRPPTSLCLQDSAAQRALNVFPSRLDASSTFSLYGLLARGRTAMVRVGASLCRS